MRSVLRVGALVLAGMLFLVGPQSVDPAEAATYREKKVLRMVNKTRVNRDRVKLRMHSTTRRKAHRHSEWMASEGRIFHSSCLSCMVPSSGWSIAGENVAMATSLRGAHRALMNSKPHRRNILNRQFRKAGIGVVKRGGYFYITQVFFG